MSRVLKFAAIPAASLVAIALLAAGHRAPAVSSTDFGRTVTPTSPVYRAELSPVGPAGIKEFRIPISHDTVQIADGVRYDGWTFGGTVPGPVIRVRQGDLVRIKLVNQAPMPHSIDFHAARIPMSTAFRTIMPGDSLSFEFTATTPGAYLVHCGTAPVLLHIMQGMYLPIIVDPKDGWPDHADREFIVLQSEFYPRADSTRSVEEPDYAAALADQPTYVVFNGRAAQYQQHPLQVSVGDRVRLFVVNAGPNEHSDFHIVGTMFDKVYPDGNLSHALENVQTWSVPAGSGAVFETHFDADGSGAGTYAFVTHSFAAAAKGAVGLIQVSPATATR